MKGLIETMRLQSALQRNGDAASRVGIVASYDPNDYAVRVRLMPEDVLTGWMPVMAAWVGNGWGMFAPPTPGDLVDVRFIEGDLNAGMAYLRFFNDQARPLSVPSGEFWLVHKLGAFFKLTNDGKATFDDGHGAHVTLNGDGTISSAGTWTHTGQFTATTDVIGGGKSLKTHTHGGVQTGTGNTGAPN